MHVERSLPAVGIVLCVAILAAHAGLLGEAHWRGDDYICAAFARDFGWRYLWQARIDGWSPRPLSELVYFGYGRLAAAFMRPFTVPFLGLLWGLLFATVLITARAANAVRILIGLSVACMFLLGHRIAELFFWPAGAVAYLTTLAASSLALFLLIDGRTTSSAGRLALSASLVACAASSETGAIAAVPLSVLLAASQPRPVLLLVPPLPVAGFVLFTLAHHRMVSPEAIRQLGVMHHLASSLRPVPRDLLADLLSLWPAKLCLVAGLRWSSPGSAPARQPRRTLAVFAAALVVAAAASIAAGYYQFGTSCCQRHDSLRQCWIVLALAALAVASTRWPPGLPTRRLGPAMLILACLIGLAPRLPALLADYRLMPAIATTLRANWQAGRMPDIGAMTFRLPPRTALAGGLGIPPGSYREPAAGDWTAHGIMDFFGKRRIAILAPP
ncbi:hypothetical protein [Lichenicoccus sp.]|uniref:hypothetical protein n=1 Tax=Lichenicoccus sp. TaxID=2781899 RepID=UPI003D10A6E6